MGIRKFITREAIEAMRPEVLRSVLLDIADNDGILVAPANLPRLTDTPFTTPLIEEIGKGGTHD